MLLSAILLALLLSCSGGFKTLEGEDEIFLDPSFWRRAEAMFEESGGGWWLREKITTVRFEGGNWYVSEDHHDQLVVLNAETMEEYADVSIPFGPTSRVAWLHARTITSAGEVIPVPTGSIFERSRIPGFMLYADTKAKVFAMPGFSDRCVIDLIYRIEDQALYFMDAFEFGDVLPVRKARYSYAFPRAVHKAGYRIHYMNHNVDAVPRDEGR